MTDWCAAGFAPEAFWQQTPRTFNAAMAGALARLKANAERDVALAHTTALFTRAKKLEPLERYLRSPSVRPAKSMLDRVRAIAKSTEAMGEA